MLLLYIYIKFQSKNPVYSPIFYGLRTQNSNKHFNLSITIKEQAEKVSTVISELCQLCAKKG